MAKLDADEAEVLVTAGWQQLKVTDGPEFWLDAGAREVVSFPSIARALSPMIFRPQLRLYDPRYTEISARICGDDVGLLATRPLNTSPVARWETAAFDAEFVVRFTEAVRYWAAGVDLAADIEASLASRALNFWTERPISDLVYLRRARDLQAIAGALRNNRDAVRTYHDPQKVMAIALELVG